MSPEQLIENMDSQKEKLSEKALLYLKQYVNSEGFKERFKKVPSYIEEYGVNAKYNDQYIPYYYDDSDYNIVAEFKPKEWPEVEYIHTLLESPNYDPETKKITINSYPEEAFKTEKALQGQDYGTIAAHEFGHWMGFNINPYIKETDYLGNVTTRNFKETLIK